MNFFRSSKKYRQKYRVVPRLAGDTSPPLDPMLAMAMRRAGMDPGAFTLASSDLVTPSAPIAEPLTPGERFGHTFSFDTLNGALSAIERIVDDDLAARISKQSAKWLVVFDGSADPNVPAVNVHQQLASRVSELGAEDRGFSHLTMNVTKKEG